ncbi:ABC transporter permease [Arthrobacter burdickii]|uniref:ABC transporter permease n=1 Tax=Arthrobacter burdickii TaxID=3035920 RepID=A0ABT8JW09_9MICC|nr:ABC transporter permease [Arthrobacter burdickii]MDN4609356.1 ABC transporter permease [Arthrobacter burdickii]
MSAEYLTGSSATPISKEGLEATGSPAIAPPPGEPAAKGSGGRTRLPGGRRAGVVLLGLIVPVLILLAWHLSTASGYFRSSQLPSPASVLAAAVDLVQRGQLANHILISTQRVLLGFLIGSLLGVLAGALLGLSRIADILLTPTVGALRAVPSLAWVPLLVLWIGINEDSKVTLISIGAFFPVFTTLYLGLRHVDRNLVEAARAFGLNGVRLLTTVQLPAVVPALFSGLRLALAQSWLFLVAAELIASSMGLGFLLTDSQQTGRVDRIILAIILLAVIGKTTDALLGIAERWAVRRWA